MTDSKQAKNTQEFEAMLTSALGTTVHDTVDRAISDMEPIAAEALPDGYKSGYVAVIGRANVGKSTLINGILGEKIAIVSPRPQTTRLRQLGILTRDDVQIIFVDTPGIHKPRNDLGNFMMEVVKAALDDADVVLFVTDASKPPNRQDRQIAEMLSGLPPEKIVQVLNKVDVSDNPAQFKLNFETHSTLIPDAEYLSTVATEGHHVPELVETIVGRLPEGPRYYPQDQVSDITVRHIAAELLRERVLYRTKDEVPHSIAVEINEFKQRQNGTYYIHATIFVERDGQKGIIIGKGGEMLKRISSEARHSIETFVDNKVYLEVRVKVLANWRKDENALKRLGYRL